MRASITVSRISISLLIAAALSLCPAPSAAAPTMQWAGDQTVTGVLTVGAPTVWTPVLTIPGAYPMQFTYGGSETYTKSVIFNNSTNGFLIDVARTGNSTSYPSYNFGVARRGESTPMFFVNGDTKNVGIGTAAPSARLDVCTSAYNGYAARVFNDGNGTQYGGLVIQNGQDTPTGTNTAIRFLDGNGEQVGTITWDSNSLDVTYGSDAGLKMNIRDFAEDSLSKIRQTRVAAYERTVAPGQTHTGFIAQELAVQFPEAVFADVETSTGLTFLCIKPMKLIPHMFHAIQQADERIAKLEAAAGSGALGEVATAGVSSVSGASTADVAPEETMSDAEILRLTESVLRRMGIEPWVEITPAEAWEEVDETAPVSAVETVTRYRFNLETRLAEAYSVQETVTRQEPTGRKIVQLKKDVRLDEKTGKFYKWCGLGGATPKETAAALGKLSRQIASLETPDSRLKTPVSSLKPQASSLKPAFSIGR